jgi:hypothetical protein
MNIRALNIDQVGLGKKGKIVPVIRSILSIRSQTDRTGVPLRIHM